MVKSVLDPYGSRPYGIEMPKLDEILTPEEFHELLVQDKDDFEQQSGGTRVWITLLGYSVRT